MQLMNNLEMTPTTMITATKKLNNDYIKTINRQQNKIVILWQIKILKGKKETLVK